MTILTVAGCARVLIETVRTSLDGLVVGVSSGEQDDFLPEAVGEGRPYRIRAGGLA